MPNRPNIGALWRVEQAKPSPAELKGAICRGTVRLCVDRYASQLSAIVLTGSLARDEATFVLEGERSRLLGDADFFLVFHENCSLPAPSHMESLRQGVEGGLRHEGLLAHIGLAPVRLSYLRTLPRHISPYELRACGKVVWGDGEVLGLIPEFTVSEVALEDAWRMFANRLIEFMEVHSPLAEGPEATPEVVRYRTIKLVLDMATSYLVFTGRYLPTYRERAQALSSLANGPGSQRDTPFPLPVFAEAVNACTRLKVETWRQDIASTVVSTEETLEYARALWRWELQRLTGEQNQLSERELMCRWMRQQSVRQRLRGWASAVRRTGGIQRWREGRRWANLALRASPRYWVYSVAAELLCRPSADATELQRLSRGLPLFHKPEPEDPKQTRQWLASETAWNYHCFLEDTRA